LSTQEFDFLLFDPARLPQAGHFFGEGQELNATTGADIAG